MELHNFGELSLDKDTNGLIYCLGIGEDGLCGQKRDIVDSSSLIISPKRFFNLVPKGIKCLDLIPIDKTIKVLKDFSGPGHAVVLASGDPLFFGIGKRLLKEIDNNKLVFYPAPTWIQSACARLKITWEDTKWVSLHGRNDDILRQLAPFLIPGYKVAVLTDPKNTPSKIASSILSHPASKDLNIKFHIAQNLAQEDERVESLDIKDVVDREFSPLNITIIDIKDTKRITGFGLHEDFYIHEGGLITKAEVRAVVLSKLDLYNSKVFWDVGAGSGSVSIEGSRISPFTSCYAIEREETRFSQLKTNISNHIAFGVFPVLGEAPDILKVLPDPDRVFIGGGICTKGLLEEISKRLKREGILVVTCVLLESFRFLLENLPKLGFKFNLIELQVSRSDTLGSGYSLKAQNPIFVFQAIKSRS